MVGVFSPARAEELPRYSRIQPSASLLPITLAATTLATNTLATATIAAAFAAAFSASAKATSPECHHDHCAAHAHVAVNHDGSTC